jgi:HK97 family phage major capsid protein
MDIDVSSHAPETKAGIGHAAVSHDDVMRLFEEFKAANDERLDQIERRSADVVTEDKVERINAALTRRLDELTLKSARPSLGATRESKALGHDASEHKAAFESYMRSGESAGLRALEVKAMSAGSDADGGYTVPVEIEQSIGERLTAFSRIRSIAGQRSVSGNVE